MLDVSSGQVTFMFDQMTAALPLLQSGKLKLLAVTTAKRIALSPQTPTMQEAGVKDFEMSSWQAIYAPKGTPAPIVERLYTEIAGCAEAAGRPCQARRPTRDGDRRRSAPAARGPDGPGDSALGRTGQEVGRRRRLSPPPGSRQPLVASAAAAGWLRPWAMASALGEGFGPG